MLGSPGQRGTVSCTGLAVRHWTLAPDECCPQNCDPLKFLHLAPSGIMVMHAASVSCEKSYSIEN